MATFQGKPAASADDGWHDEGASTFDNSGTSISIIGYDNLLETPPNVGFVRIPNVTVPQGATISAASFDFVATAKSTPGTIYISGFDEDNSAQVADVTDYFTRAETTATEGLTFGSLTAGGSFTTGDFKGVVQEIVDRAGWASGNAMQFRLYQSSAFGPIGASIASYDHATYTEPTLNITYTAGGGGGTSGNLLLLGVG